MSKGRQIQNRRDRRKAKQSNWKRPGKSSQSKIGHGGSGQVSKRLVKPRKVSKKHMEENLSPIYEENWNTPIKDKPTVNEVDRSECGLGKVLDAHKRDNEKK